MLRVSDYVTGQIEDHGITGEAVTKRYLERNEPVAILRLVSYSHSPGQKFTPTSLLFYSGSFKWKSTKRNGISYFYL